MQIALTPKQALLKNVIEQTQHPYIMYGGARGGAKEQDIKTIIPTPTGYTTIGEVKVGDYIYGRDGYATQVIWKSEVDYAPKSYEIEFSTGEKIKCDAGHLWQTLNTYERRHNEKCTNEYRAKRRAKRPSRAKTNPINPGSQKNVTLLNQKRKYIYKGETNGTVRTTKEIFDTLKHKDEINHAVNNASPIQNTQKQLLIEPYLLGVWLGDGYSACGTVGMMKDDIEEMMAYIQTPIRSKRQDFRYKSPFIIYIFEGLIQKLRVLNLRNNKHIPIDYLRGSYEQRLDLLKGLMDTDGTCDPRGHCKITLSKKNLIEQVHELISTFGIKSNIIEKKDKKGFVSYAINFMPDFICFNLKRKRDRQIIFNGQSKRRYIVNVTKCDPVPMQCITVANPDGMYLITKSYIPTHNSYSVRKLAIFFARKYKIPVLVMRRYRDDLLKNHILPLFREHPFLEEYFNKTELILYNKPVKQNGKQLLIKFDYAETEDDIYKVAQGTEYPIIFVDEATQIPQFSLEYIKTANRDAAGLLPFREKIIYTANPGGISHAYLKRIFVDKIYQQNESKDDYYFIQSHVWDTVFWSLKELTKQGFTVDDYYYKWDEKQRIDFTLKYSTYAKTLAGLPEQLKMAYLFGDWNVFGGMFFKGFSTIQEVIKPFPIPEGWSLVGCLDPGFASPMCYSLLAKDYRGNVITVGTYYKVGHIPDHVRAIKDWLVNPYSPIYPYLKGRLPDYTVAGRDAFSKLDKNAIASNEDTLESYFVAQGIPLIRGNDGAHSRVPNWWTWKSLIPDRYFIFEGLGNEPLITQLTSVESDKRNPEDIQGLGNDDNVEDHALDANKLGVSALNTPKKINIVAAQPSKIIVGRQYSNNLSDKSYKF